MPSIDSVPGCTRPAKHGKISTATAGNVALVAAVTGRKIRVLALHLIGTTSTNSIYINDGTADLYGDSTRKIPLDVTGAAGAVGICLPFCDEGWFETIETGRPINVNLGSTNGVIGTVVYREIGQ